MNVLRKPRMYFDEATHATGVTFDDGQRCRLNMPWSHFRCADWEYADPTIIRVEIGDWQVVVSGHNLAPLFEAIEEARLKRVRAHPELKDDPAHEADVFATCIQFIPQSSASPKRGQAAQLHFPI